MAWHRRVAGELVRGPTAQGVGVHLDRKTSGVKRLCGHKLTSIRAPEANSEG